MAVKIPVVLYESFLAVLLGNKENRGCLGRYQQLDFSTSQVFIEKLVEFLSFLGGQGVDTPLLWFKAFDEFYFVVESTTMLWKRYINLRKYHFKPFILFR